ncbi:MAG: glutaredoxin family protein [Elusimicrobiota bacterium]
MLKLIGSPSCGSCVLAQKLLNRHGIRYQYVDVSNQPFEGIIPQLILPSGEKLIGLGPINKAIRERKI